MKKHMKETMHPYVWPSTKYARVTNCKILTKEKEEGGGEGG